MSARHVREIVRASFEDADSGLRARVAAIIAAREIPGISADVHFVRWLLSGKMQQGTIGNVSIYSPRTVSNLLHPGIIEREGRHDLQISFETFGADPGEIEDTIDIYEEAVLGLLGDLRDWSDAHPDLGATIMVVNEPATISRGPFAYPGAAVTTSGFICTVTVTDRSPDDA